MSTFRSGNGGFVLVGAVHLDVAKWEVDDGIRDTENTHSGSAGFTNFETVVGNASWTIDVPWDEANMPDTTAGLVPGNKVTIKFMHGAGAKFVLLTNTLVGP